MVLTTSLRSSTRWATGREVKAQAGIEIVETGFKDAYDAEMEQAGDHPDRREFALITDERDGTVDLNARCSARREPTTMLYS